MKPAERKGNAMIVEYIHYAIPEDRRNAFESAYAVAQSALHASSHCLGWELAGCAEDPTQYILRIEWDFAEGHMSGFRRSPEFRAFLPLVRPFIEDIQEMRHYELTAVRGDKPDAGDRQ